MTGRAGPDRELSRSGGDALGSEREPSVCKGWNAAESFRSRLGTARRILCSRARLTFNALASHGVMAVANLAYAAADND